jgi:hypothetical protein
MGNEAGDKACAVGALIEQGRKTGHAAILLARVMIVKYHERCLSASVWLFKEKNLPLTKKYLCLLAI